MWLDIIDLVTILNIYESDKLFDCINSSIVTIFFSTHISSKTTIEYKTVQDDSLGFELDDDNKVLSVSLHNSMLKKGYEISYDDFIRLLRKYGKAFFDQVSPQKSLEINFCDNGGNNKPKYDEYEAKNQRIISLVLDDEGRVLRLIII